MVVHAHLQKKYFFNPRSNTASNQGMVFWRARNSGSVGPSTWATGDVTMMGAGSSAIPATTGPTLSLDNWGHCAWVKLSDDAKNNYI